MNRKSQKKSFFLSSSKRRTRWWSVQQWCPPMEEMEASSVAKTVACESNRLNPPQAAIDNRCFRRPACSTHSNLPGSRACRHRTSSVRRNVDYARLCRLLTILIRHNLHKLVKKSTSEVAYHSACASSCGLSRL